MFNDDEIFHSELISYTCMISGNITGK